MAKRFRIALSFAGEKRDFVSQVANILANQFGEDKILYDKFHESEFARARLGRYLPKLYHDETDLSVVVICHDYSRKEWCGLEWDAIFDLLKKRQDGEVMLAHFDHSKVEGLFSDAGYVELDHKTPEQAAGLILERLALNEGHTKDHYTKRPLTPPASPASSAAKGTVAPSAPPPKKLIVKIISVAAIIAVLVLFFWPSSAKISGECGGVVISNFESVHGGSKVQLNMVLTNFGSPTTILDWQLNCSIGDSVLKTEQSWQNDAPPGAFKFENLSQKLSTENLGRVPVRGSVFFDVFGIESHQLSGQMSTNPNSKMELSFLDKHNKRWVIPVDVARLYGENHFTRDSTNGN